jgi:hypothetical protein
VQQASGMPFSVLPAIDVFAHALALFTDDGTVTLDGVMRPGNHSRIRNYRIITLSVSDTISSLEVARFFMPSSPAALKITWAQDGELTVVTYHAGSWEHDIIAAAQALASAGSSRVIPAEARRWPGHAVFETPLRSHPKASLPSAG